MKSSKTIISIALFLSLMFLISVPASAASDDGNEYRGVDEIICSIPAENSSDYVNSVDSINEPKKSSTKNEYINYILNGYKTFSHAPTEMDIDDLLANSKNISTNSKGNVTGTFTSARFDTGTPFVTWDYVVAYEIEPFANGYGWKFVTAQPTIRVYKGLLLYTWASYCNVTFNSSSYSINSARTSVTVDFELKFEVMTDAMYGMITYYEDHTHTTYISNLSQY